MKTPLKRDKLFPNSIRDGNGKLIFSIVFPNGQKTGEEMLLESHIVDRIVEAFKA